MQARTGLRKLKLITSRFKEKTFFLTCLLLGKSQEVHFVFRYPNSIFSKGGKPYDKMEPG